MGLLDFLQTPQGQALAAGVATYAATARRNTPINNLGRGALGAFTGYGNAIDAQRQAEQQKIKDAYNQQMMGYNTQQAETAAFKAQTERMRAMQKRKELEQAAQGDIKMFQRVLGGDYKADIGDEDYQIIPAGMWDDGTPAAQPVADKTPFTVNESMAKMYGFTPEDMQYIQGLYDMDPKEALKEMRAIRQAGRKNRAEFSGKLGQAMQFMQMTPEQRKAAQEYNSLFGSKGQNISIQNIMPGEAAEAAGRKEGMEIGEQAAMIENKYSAIDSVREAKDMLKQGIYSGYWGEMGKTIAKASLGAVGDRQKAARTEQFMSYVGNTVVPRLKEFGGNDSNEEMKYLQRIMGGDITMEPEAIAAILESAERKIARGIERLQRQRGALESGKMPDLGPGPARGQKSKTKVTPLPNTTPSVDDLLKKYGGK